MTTSPLTSRLASERGRRWRLPLAARGPCAHRLSSEEHHAPNALGDRRSPADARLGGRHLEALRREVRLLWRSHRSREQDGKPLPSRKLKRERAEESRPGV